MTHSFHEQGGQVCLESQATLQSPAPSCSRAPEGSSRLCGSGGSPAPRPAAGVGGCSVNVYSMHRPGPSVDMQGWIHMHGPAMPWASCCPGAQLCQVKSPARISSATEIFSSSNRIKLPSLQRQQVLKVGERPPTPFYPQPSLAFHTDIPGGDSPMELTNRGGSHTPVSCGRARLTPSIARLE